MNFNLILTDKQVALIQLALHSFAEQTLQSIAQQCHKQAKEVQVEPKGENHADTSS